MDKQFLGVEAHLDSNFNDNLIGSKAVFHGNDKSEAMGIANRRKGGSGSGSEQKLVHRMHGNEKNRSEKMNDSNGGLGAVLFGQDGDYGGYNFGGHVNDQMGLHYALHMQQLFGASMREEETQGTDARIQPGITAMKPRETDTTEPFSKDERLHQQQQLEQRQQQQRKDKPHRIEEPIPPLLVQQKLTGTEGDDAALSTALDRKEEEQKGQTFETSCTRCKKVFLQLVYVSQEQEKSKSEPKFFKLCQHCRDLQRKRSRRWQIKTKNKTGTCRRCGLVIPEDQQKYVLCPSCRENLRTRKANRAAQGKCVHCSGPLEASIIASDDMTKLKETVKHGSFKVCQRCRKNDKIRRTNLERKGHCNRCAKSLHPDDFGRHKVCLHCRSRKRRSNSSSETYDNRAPNSGIDELSLLNNPLVPIMDDHNAMSLLSGTTGFVPSSLLNTVPSNLLSAQHDALSLPNFHSHYLEFPQHPAFNQGVTLAVMPMPSLDTHHTLNVLNSLTYPPDVSYKLYSLHNLPMLQLPGHNSTGLQRPHNYNSDFQNYVALYPSQAASMMLTNASK